MAAALLVLRIVDSWAGYTVANSDQNNSPQGRPEWMFALVRRLWISPFGTPNGPPDRLMPIPRAACAGHPATHLVGQPGGLAACSRGAGRTAVRATLRVAVGFP